MHNLPLSNLSILGLFLLLLLPAVGVEAQDFDNYQNIECVGEIPQEFLTLSSFKVERQKTTEIDDASSRKERKSKEDFLLQSNFVIDNLLASGRVLFNDPVTDYVRRVSDYVLRDNPELKEEIRIYTVKSSAVNAFATNNGIVFITLGLIARLENEAQLAFILCHEYQHYLHKHPINKYVETQRIKKDAGLLKRLSFDEQILMRNQFSREQETEADDKAFSFYKNTVYDYGALDGLFDILLTSHLPLGNRLFDHKFFETENLVFPDHILDYNEDTTKIDEDYDDDKSTHPSIGKRRRIVKEKVAAEDNDGRRGFLFTPKEFLEIRKIARFELSSIYLGQLRYEEALYSAWLMLQVEPNSRYLKKIALRSLYGLTKYANNYKLNEVHWDPNNAHGNFRKLPAMFDNMYRFELNAVALRYGLGLQNDHPDDKEIREVVTDLWDEIAVNHQNFIKHLSLEPKPAEIDSAGDDDDLQEEKNSFARWAFADVLSDGQIKSEWDTRLNEGWSSEREENNLAAMIKPRSRVKGFRLGLDKVVFVDPIYQKVDQRKKIPVAYMAGESGQQRMKTIMQESASSTGLDLEILERKTLKKDEVQRFNDMAYMKSWVGKRMKTIDLDYYVPVDQTDVADIVDRYGTPYFGVTGILAVTEPKSNMYKYYVLCLGCMTVYGLPIAIISAFTPKKNTYYLTMIFNVETGAIMMANIDRMNVMPRGDYVKSKVYDIMYQISKR